MKGKGPLFISGVQALSLPNGEVDCRRRRAGYSDDSSRLTNRVQGQCRPACGESSGKVGRSCSVE